MNFIQSYNEAVADSDILNEFINNNFDKIYDYYNLTNYENISRHRDNFSRLTLTIESIRKLNFSIQKNEAYLNLLLKTAVRLGDLFVFQQLQGILISHGLQQSSLIKACSLFMKSRTSQDFINVYDEMLNLLEETYEKETDSNKEPIAIFIYFYALFVHNFCEFATADVIGLRARIQESYHSKDYGFLDDIFIEEILNISIDHGNNSYEKIQILLDDFLKRNNIPTVFLSGFLIEENTDYASKINANNYTVSEIQELNKRIYMPIQSKEVFNSLGRGVAILEFEKQLFAYMYAHGKKHIAKLEYTFKNISKEDLKEVNIIDWGCGQGIASKAYLDFFGPFEVKSVVLIEPSECALRRASLHIHKEVKNILTINKEFNFLKETDLLDISSNKTTDLHLFSNVIDMDFLDLSKLIELIKKSFIGKQYFIICSPHIDASKTERIDSFTEKLMNGSGILLLNTTKSSGNWINDWSKVIRVFKVNL